LLRLTALLVHVFLIALTVLQSERAHAIADDAPAPDVLAFERFVVLLSPICARGASTDCFEYAFDFTDTNGDEQLSRAELVTVRDALEDWTVWRQESLSTRERNGIRLGLWLVDTIGLPTLEASYDDDRDGLLSRAEMLADVTLDERPLGEVVLDPAAVDRRAIARRLGMLMPLLDQALPEAE
jgi:Ca2+-binding EF-hand superfamily protein